MPTDFAIITCTQNGIGILSFIYLYKCSLHRCAAVIKIIYVRLMTNGPVCTKIKIIMMVVLMSLYNEILGILARFIWCCIYSLTL